MYQPLAYTAMLKIFVIPELIQRNKLNDIVWIQVAAPPLTAKMVRRFMGQHFDDVIFYSMVSEIPPSDCYGFLVLGIH